METHLGKGSVTMPGGKVKGCLSSQDKFRHQSFLRDQVNTAQAPRTNRVIHCGYECARRDLSKEGQLWGQGRGDERQNHVKPKLDWVINGCYPDEHHFLSDMVALDSFSYKVD